MALAIRRVVTGHDADGKAIVTIDEVASGEPRRPGAEAATIWTSMGFPVDNTGASDEARREGLATFLPGGTVFRVLALEPGNAPRMHRTDSIDYAVVLSGEVDMDLDEQVVHLKAGDTVVQRGTIHNWANRGTEPCVLAFILIDAKPVEVGGKVLNAVG